MIKDLPQFVSQKVCLSCEGCCRFREQNSSWRPKMAQEEINGEEGVFAQELDGNNCIRTVECRGQFRCTFFHTEDNVCHIYAYRPFECRLYPFLLTKHGGDAAISVHLSCPHIQEKWQSEDLNSYVEDLRKYFQQEEVLEFVRRNPSLPGDHSKHEQEIEHLFDLTI